VNDAINPIKKRAWATMPFPHTMKKTDAIKLPRVSRVKHLITKSKVKSAKKLEKLIRLKKLIGLPEP
jgi:hypothetical protein